MFNINLLKKIGLIILVSIITTGTANALLVGNGVSPNPLVDPAIHDVIAPPPQFDKDTPNNAPTGHQEAFNEQQSVS